MALKESGRCCCHGAFGFPGRAGGALGPETKPRGTTANLSALPNFLPASFQSSLLFKLQGSHTACLGVEFILNKCFAWLTILKKKKKSNQTLKIRRFHSKFPLPSFSGKLKICNPSQLGPVLRAEQRLPLYSPLVPKVSTQLAPPHGLLACILCATEFLTPVLPSQRWETKR